MPLLVTLAILGLIGWGIWQACRPPSVFVVRIERGVPRIVRGTVTNAFVREIRELCLHHGVRHGIIRGQLHGTRIALDLRGPFPPEFRQQLRNVWSFSGWSAGRRTPQGRADGL